MLPRSSISTLFPYTTLFRSKSWSASPARRRCVRESATARGRLSHDDHRRHAARRRWSSCDNRPRAVADSRTRSEEHTSELQSRENLVCRLLLEKKKKKETTN